MPVQNAYNSEISHRDTEDTEESIEIFSLCPLCLCGTFVLCTALRDKLLDNLPIPHDVDRPVAGAHELFLAVDADLVVERHREVLDAEGLVGGLGADRVRGAVDDAALDPA